MSIEFWSGRGGSGENGVYRFAAQLTGCEHNGHQNLAVPSSAMGHEVGAHRKTHGAGGDWALEGLVGGNKNNKQTNKEVSSS